MHRLSALGYSQCTKKTAALRKTTKGNANVLFSRLYTVACSTLSMRYRKECSMLQRAGHWTPQPEVWINGWLNPIQLQAAGKAHELTFPSLSPLLLILQLQASQFNESHQQPQSVQGRDMCGSEQGDWEAAPFFVAATVRLG